MRDRKRHIAVEGIICLTSLKDSAKGCESSVTIETKAGHCFRVERSFIGRYLVRFEGAYVAAEGELLSGGERGGVLRITGLTVRTKARITMPNDIPTAELPADGDFLSI